MKTDCPEAQVLELGQTLVFSKATYILRSFSIGENEKIRDPGLKAYNYEL